MENRDDFLRVMSFNVLLDWRKEGQYVWSNRKDMVASMIRFHHVDIVGLQEPLSNQVNDLSKLLPEYAWLGVGREDGVNKGEFAAIFYLKERLEPLETSTFWLSEAADVPGSLGWDAACVRIATWAKFLDKKRGKSFFHFNTHFDHVGMIAQENSARLLLERITSIAGADPVIVTGDFNCGRNSETYKILTGADSTQNIKGQEHLKDAMYASWYSHHGPIETYHGLEDEVKKETIDYIFVKNALKVMQHGVLEDKLNGRYPSDHSPVVADVVIDQD